MTISSALTNAEGERLAARVAELEKERKHLLAIIEILKEVSSSLHFIDILQAIARKLGEAFGLDRCSIFLADRGGQTVRLVASFEDPTIRNHVVDLARYPELKRAMQAGETVFIPDAPSDPMLRHVKDELASRRCYLHPFRWTSLGLSLIEAMLLGMPAVALATTDVPDSVPSSAGIVSNDLDRLQRGIARLHDDHDYAADLGRAARLHALDRFSHDRFLADWDRLLETTCR